MKQKYKHLSEFSEQEILDAIDKSSNKLDVYRNLGYDVDHLNGSLHRWLTKFMKEHNIPNFRPSYITEEDYLQNPKYCKQCGKIIPYKNRRNNFCNQSCASSYNNVLREGNLHKKNKYCLNCGQELINSQEKYCCSNCGKEYRQKLWIEKWKFGEESGITGKYEISVRLRQYLFNKYNSQCQICGWKEVNPSTGLVPLQIHHIDGNCLNNNEENLQLLCPNCHSLTPTFGNLNRQSSRVFRKQKENI